MNKRQVFTVLFLSLLAAVAYYIFQERQFVSQEVREDEKLVFPNLRAGEIHTMVVSNRFGTLTFKKQGDDWAIVEKENYLADPVLLNETLSALTNLKIAQKTLVDESQWAQIGVQDPGEAGAIGVGCRVDLYGADGYERGIIIGSLQASDSEASRMFGAEFDGRNFIREKDSNQIYLVGQSLSFFNTIPSNWLMNILSNPYAYKSITYVDEGERVWSLVRGSRAEPYLLYGESDDVGTPLPNLTQTVDYAFASMFIKDVFPADFERNSVDISGDRYFELEALDGFAQRIYIGGKTRMSEQERLSGDGASGVMRKVRTGTYRYAFIEWLSDRIKPSPNEPPYSGRTYLVHGPKMNDLMINHDEMLVFERLSPASNN
ncbi:DUF4340 domain-containing protein [Rubellicoccus peritrichatus]|uniref:DUF4340 domain-containing protein n=1 Tax=Rubellicoccus peritrichatus TaxID=3080537 RepID=A0AAQ3LDJ9_9BACT|nr:DUF4340 domain-containing protein [Puniceicoccus sp. CR14]WOO42577.1 DUF4340 domain-containing protein [Puniceicoccus sp. CR14]